jgi:hypothetical protein
MTREASSTRGAVTSIGAGFPNRQLEFAIRTLHLQPPCKHADLTRFLLQFHFCVQWIDRIVMECTFSMAAFPQVRMSVLWNNIPYCVMNLLVLN